MIASLHPCITKDINILCAGRLLTIREKKRLTKAQAVVVPQGVTVGGLPGMPPIGPPGLS